MAAVSIHSDFGIQENELCHCFHFSPFLRWSDGSIEAVILGFWMLSFKPALSLSSFTLIKKLFSSSSLSAIRSPNKCLSIDQVMETAIII